MSITHGIDRMDKNKSQDESQPGKGGVGWCQTAPLTSEWCPAKALGEHRESLTQRLGGGIHELFTYGIFHKILSETPQLTTGRCMDEKDHGICMQC